jgi:hypothetical protein
MAVPPVRRLALALTVAAFCACGRGGESRVTTDRLAPLFVALDTARGADSAALVLNGLIPGEVAALMAARLTPASFGQLISVRVAGGDSTPVAGRWTVSDTAVEFRPLYPFDRGRAYAVRIDPARLIPPRAGAILDTVVSLPARDRTPVTEVTRILPTGDSLPENLLRLYVEFSAPMSREGGLEHVRLLDDRGREVAAAFLPLEADFWNADRTRYTLFLDPGRVKRGILPNEQMGRAIVAGRRYSIVVDATWRDGEGRPLRGAFRRDFVVARAIETPLSTAAWRISPPVAGTREPLVVTFDRALDHGLLRRALGVSTARGQSVAGESVVEAGETVWRFTPRDAWRAGAYRLIALAILEDPSGNRIGRAFEVDRFDRVDSARVEQHQLPFEVSRGQSR